MSNPTPTEGDEGRASIREDDDETPKESLNSMYGNRIGFLQSLSLLLNAGLMVYAHVGLSAIIVSNQQRIQDSVDQTDEDTTASGGGGRGVCSASDIAQWTNGGAQNKSDDTQFCSREYTSPVTGRTCLLDQSCAEMCFRDEIGYSEPCANCFAAVPTCTLAIGCAFLCAEDRTSPECLECIVPCDDAFYNCTGLTPVQGACDARDVALWENGGAQNKSDDTDFCSREYVNPATGRVGGCLLNQGCSETCFQQEFGYSEPCATCFAAVPICTFRIGCAFICANDRTSTECLECNKPCDEEFYNCSGLAVIETSMDGNNSGRLDTENGGLVDGEIDVCKRQQEGVNLEDVEEYFVVYEILFFEAVHTAWTSDARLLAVIVVVFSGFWPYAKNLILMMAWYLPLTNKRRSSVLKWLRRLGKYTLVDIYVVIILMVGVQIQLMVAGDVPVIVKAEPRGAIISFLIATIHEFIQIEWMTHCHQAKQKPHHEEEEEAAGGDQETSVFSAMRFQNGYNTSQGSYACKSPVMLQIGMKLLLAATVGLFVAGSLLENIWFTATVGEDAEGCVRSYNVYTLATSLTSDFFLDQNSAKPGVWTLVCAYMVLVSVLPILVHSVQLVVSLFNVQSKLLCQVADISWTFASIEVLLLGLFVVQYKFDALIGALAGNDNSEFFGITSQVGPGFYLLLVYSVASGLMHYFFSSSVSQFYQLDPYHKVDCFWTVLFGSCLEDRRQSSSPKRLTQARSDSA